MIFNIYRLDKEWKVEFEFMQRTEESTWNSLLHISKSPGYNGYNDGECGSRYPALWFGPLTIHAASCVNGNKELDKSFIIS